MKNKYNDINFSDVLKKLRNHKSIKYSEWENEKNNINIKEEMEKRAGIYHFYKKLNSNIKSLYIGKAGFGKTDTWNLYRRISQHFQGSQANTILGKCGRDYLENNVLLQWLPIYKLEENKKITLIKLPENIDIEKTLVRIEYYCIAILNPEFTKG